MLDNVVLGKYYPITSRIHEMNPVAKVLCTLLYIALIFITNDFFIMTLVFILSILLVELAHLPKKIYKTTIKSLKIILIFMIIIYALLGYNWMDISMMAMRLIGIVLYTTVLTLTTPPNEITYGLNKVFAPLNIIGVPVNKMSLSISLSLRFVPSIIDQANRILKSQASRGVDYSNSKPKGKIIAVKALIYPMFALTLRKADILAEAMQVRLYNINGKRTNFRQNKWHLFDTFLFLLHAILLGIFIIKGVVV